MVYGPICHSKHSKRTRQLKFKRELRNFPSRNNPASHLELNENKVMELLEDLSNILRAFLIKQFFTSACRI